MVTDVESRRAAERFGLLDAIVTALDRRAEVLEVISASEDANTARRGLIQVLAVTEMGASAILELQMRRYTRAKTRRVRAERDDASARRGG